MNGCDSIVATTLTVLPISSTTVAIELCEGETYLAGGMAQTASGVYQDTLISVNGCDSILTTTLTFQSEFLNTSVAEICEGESILLGGILQTTSGVYIDSLTSINGCDSILTTTLTVHPTYELMTTASICAGDSILLGNTYQTVGGIYDDTLSTSTGCDSIIITELIILSLIHI